ncbi:TIGR00270 family protein [Candidatus Woesearchaeota archaeon]|nr:TIGR00270 family protein [Candidatus Woesearchaeota archaeon]
MLCEMCGKEGELVKADIEGAELIVCRACAKFGKIISIVRPPLSKQEKKARDENTESKPVDKLKREIIQLINDDYPQLIKNAREKMGLKQQELALKIAEKESLIHNIESGKFLPSIVLARKFERFLKIKLIEQHEETEEDSRGKASKQTALTIGDMLNLKK